MSDCCRLSGGLHVLLRLVFEEIIYYRNDEPCVVCVGCYMEDRFFLTSYMKIDKVIVSRVIGIATVEIVSVDDDGLLFLFDNDLVPADLKAADVDSSAVFDPVDKTVCYFLENNVVHGSSDSLKFFLNSLVKSDAV